MLLLLGFSLLPAFTIRATAAETDWAIVSSAPVDPRIEAQVKDLAGQAGVNIFKTQAQTLRAHPAFTIELITAANARAFDRNWPKGRTLPARDVVEQAYRVQVDYINGREALTPRRARITALSPEGFHYGLLRISQLLNEFATGKVSDLNPKPQVMISASVGRAASIGVADFPSFAARGVVEVFYGTPWSHQDRLDILKFEGEHGMNAYYYAPKDDPYHRKQWRDPYPPDRLAQLGELVTAARANFVDFCFAVSPGLSMTYSSDDDFAKLTEKLESVGKLGTSCYALFLDDVPEEIQNDADKSRFKTLAAAHAYVINKLYHHLVALSPKNHLVALSTR